MLKMLDSLMQTPNLTRLLSKPGEEIPMDFSESCRQKAIFNFIYLCVCVSRSHKWTSVVKFLQFDTIFQDRINEPHLCEMWIHKIRTKFGKCFTFGLISESRCTTFATYSKVKSWTISVIERCMINELDKLVDKPTH